MITKFFYKEMENIVHIFALEVARAKNYYLFRTNIYYNCLLRLPPEQKRFSFTYVIVCFYFYK